MAPPPAAALGLSLGLSALGVACAGWRTSAGGGARDDARAAQPAAWAAHVSRGCAKQHNDQVGSPIVVCENVDDYRRVIPQIVRRSDTVLELGCMEGMTTSLIDVLAGKTVGVDKSAHAIAIARTRWPSIPFYEIDAVEDIRALMALGSFSIIFLDISGSRDLATLVPLIERLDSVFSPRMLVVKAFKLKRLLNRLALPSAVGDAPSTEAYAQRAAVLREQRHRTDGQRLSGGPTKLEAQRERGPVVCAACSLPTVRADFSGKQWKRLCRGDISATCLACIARSRERAPRKAASAST